MNHENKSYSVYIKTDENGRITAINSDVYLKDKKGWIEIDRGFGDKFHHAQNNYLGSLFDDRGLYLYKFVNGVAERRTDEEINADYVPPKKIPTHDERLKALEDGLELIKKLISAFTGGIK